METDQQVQFEAVAADLAKDGYQPHDSEPGEWLVMRHPDGREITIYPDYFEES